jgi:hypothetical protein
VVVARVAVLPAQSTPVVVVEVVMELVVLVAAVWLFLDILTHLEMRLQPRAHQHLPTPADISITNLQAQDQ